MAKYIPSGSVQTKADFNAEFTKVANAINTQLDRTVASGNQMEVDMDMNSNRILNLPEPTDGLEPATKAYVDAKQLTPVAVAEENTYEYIALMKNEAIEAGLTVKCNRYYADGKLIQGLHYYVKTADQASTDGDIVDEYGNQTLINGNVAILVMEEFLKVSQFGGDSSIEDNSPNIQACYDYCGNYKKQLMFDDMFPTTQTVNFNITNVCCTGINQPAWRDEGDVDVGIQYNGTTEDPAILITAGTATHSYFKVRGTRNVAGANNIQLGEIGVVSACTIIDFIAVSTQRAGGAGYAILGNNAGESCRWERGESSGNIGSGVFLARTDTSMNNTQFSKFNSHRNGADGINLASGVQRLNIDNGCDFTLNVGAGVAFRSSVDFDSVIANNWFENNDTDILLDCDTTLRGVTSRNNKLAEATTQAIYCKSGRIKSYGDKFNNTPIGVQFDVADGVSVVRVGSVTSVPTFYSGDTSYLSHLPFEGCELTRHLFTIQNVPASQTNQSLPTISGGSAQAIKPKENFYRLRVRLNGVTPTTGSMTIRVAKNTATNVNNFLTTVIDSATVASGTKETVILFGGNTFTSSADFENFFLVYTTTADWDGTTGRVDVSVDTINL